MTNLDWIEYERKVRDWAKDQQESSSEVIDKSVFFRDGIVCQEEWGKDDNPRILFVLKEVYDPVGIQNGVTNINFINKNEVSDIYELTMWRKISMMSYLLEKAHKSKMYITRDECVITDAPKKGDNIEDSVHFKRIQRVAIMNLKKLGGGPTAESKVSKETVFFDKHCERFSKEIREQIEEINPNIIVCCSEKIYTCLTTYVYNNNENGNYCINENGVVILNGCHPTMNSYNNFCVKPINTYVDVMLDKQ